ncbi:uncharacterized protein BDZ83DRAFT_610717 [Colletotrichum acutatum]|uniref:Uncharacterized protein n=1 Tax=Glomerella acutata TaxID=27357 RepID=A0AAD8USD9_GLOAC|nr:uncharacterized protein BDZ83DRAFT_610717 [Colletotrichum acutatum]KAK1727942.1 hypothetical protein BDZ83DRAFT_610717 [Colletotrichum acutatum]
MKVPYLLDLYMCNTTRTFPSFQPQLTPRPPPKLAPEPSSATSVVRVTRSAAQPQCITAYGMIGRPSLAARCPHRRCGPLSLHDHEDQSRLQAHPGPLCNETERRGGFGTWLNNLSTHAPRFQVRGGCPPQSTPGPRLAFVRLREGAQRRLNFPVVGPPPSPTRAITGVLSGKNSILSWPPTSSVIPPPRLVSQISRKSSSHQKNSKATKLLYRVCMALTGQSRSPSQP